MFYFALIPLVYTVTHLIASHRLHQSIHQRIRSTNTNHWDFSPSHQHTLVYFGQQRSSSSQTALKRFSCLFGFLYFSLLLSLALSPTSPFISCCHYQLSLFPSSESFFMPCQPFFPSSFHASPPSLRLSLCTCVHVSLTNR